MEVLTLKSMFNTFCLAVKTIKIEIPYESYGSHLCDYNIMRVAAVSMPEPKGEIMMVERDILIDSLPIEIKVKTIWPLQ